MLAVPLIILFFFFNDTATTEIYTLSLHDALPISFLDEMSGLDQWVIGAAVLTIFVEGSVNERRELENTSPESDAAIEAAIRQHSLVRIHGVDPKFLQLQRVHKKVEGGHRLDAWKMVLDHTPATLEDRVVRMVERALESWLAYRDDVARACGIAR